MHRMADQFSEVLQRALLRNAKSTVLKALGWLVALLLSASVFASRFGTDKWLVVMLGCLDCLAILVYIAAFIFFALKDPDQLRSEKFSIQKMAMERGFIGDDIKGYFKLDSPEGVALIEGSKREEKGKANE